jgi:hypothetical protein
MFVFFYCPCRPIKWPTYFGVGKWSSDEEYVLGI